MNPAAAATKTGEISSGAASGPNRLQIDISATSQGDVTAFRAEFNRHIGGSPIAAPHSSSNNKGSLSSAIAERTNALASSVNKDQQYVSKLLETATRSGSSMELMHAMMALNDYQLRVQTISKTVSKASSAVDQLTKLQ
jgi:hypothetical protein